MTIEVVYTDLKNDINLLVCFDSPNDMIMFFSKYNPNTIDIDSIEIFE